MNIEHFAITVADPADVAAWYVEHLGMRIVRAMEVSPFTHFLTDSGGNTMIEIYNNPKVMVPDYRAIDPLLLHIAFATEDVAGERARLLAAGATAEGDIDVTPAGDTLAMLRDPWGLPIQLAHRSTAMLEW